MDVCLLNYLYFFIRSSIGMMIEELCVFVCEKLQQKASSSISKCLWYGDWWWLNMESFHYACHWKKKCLIEQIFFSFISQIQIHYKRAKYNIFRNIIHSTADWVFTYLFSHFKCSSFDYLHLYINKIKKRNLVSLSKRIFNGVLCVLRIFTFL